MRTLKTASLNRRRLLLSSLAGVGASAVPWLPAQAQQAQQSDGPVRLVVPFTAGTGIDLLARQVAPGLSERLKRPFFVENKPGASGNIGAQEVARAAPDGSVLLVGVNTMVMSSSLYTKLGFNPLTDFAPVTLSAWGQLVLVASERSGIQSLQDFMSRAKAQPGRLNYGSPGLGTPHHLAMELLKNQAKISLTHISYRGTGPAVTDLLGGQIDAMFLPIHVALQHIKAGKLKALAVSSDAENPALPQVPSLKSLKLGNLNVDMWYALFAPAGTPAPLVEQLNQAMGAILAQPEIAKALMAQGMEPAHSTPQELSRMMAADSKRWAALIKAQNIKAE